MKYSFDKISSKVNDHSIFINAMYQPGAFNRKAIGFQWGNEGEPNAKFTERTEYILTETELQILMLGKVLKLIDEFVKTVDYPQAFSIYFNGNEAVKLFDTNTDKNLLVNELITKAKLKLALLDRSGYEISIQTSLSSPSLNNTLKLALYEYKLINDFQSETLYLSSVSSKVFDNLLFDKLKEKLIQYISPTEYGIVGVFKRLITPEDEEKMNSIILEVFTANQFFSKNEKKLSEIRRSCLVVRDSDLVLMIASIFSGETIEGIEALVYFSAKYFDVPIFILDAETLTWFTKSKTDKRDLVRAKHLPKFKAYLNIGLYCSPNLSEKTWETFKKVFKN
jgi:hypothetical protein